MQNKDFSRFKVGDLVLSQFEDEGVGIIMMVPDDCTDTKRLYFARVKFPGMLETHYYQLETLITARQRYLGATGGDR